MLYPVYIFTTMRWWKLQRILNPVQRGEYEITTVNKHYLQQKKLKVAVLGPGICLAGYRTFETLGDAAEYVRVIEKRQGLKIGCPEEIA